MAGDALAVLDALGRDSAHVVGVSMGGVVAQTLAIRHPARVRTLTSIMSTPSPRIGRPRLAAMAALAGRPVPAGNWPRSTPPATAGPGLAGVRVPTLVLHGEADPLVRPAGGRATAAAVPGARLVTYLGMGHNLPRELWPATLDEIGKNSARRYT